MPIVKRVTSVIFLIWLVFKITGCPKVVTSEPVDQWGCQPPPPDVFQSVGVDVVFAQSTYGKIVTGDISVTTTPEVITLASKAATDYRIRSYIRCLAIKRDGYTPEQAAYFDRLAEFMKTTPTAEQFSAWEREHSPFKRDSSKRTPSESSVITLKNRMSDLRGTYERSFQFEEGSYAQQTALNKVRNLAAGLAYQLSILPDDKMRIQFQIAKYEYSAYGYILAALVETDMENRLTQANEALQHGRKAIELIETTALESSQGNEESQSLQLKILEDNKKNRIHYLLAMALAIKASDADGPNLLDFKREWNAIASNYKDEYPPVHPKMKWAIQQIEAGEVTQ